MAAAAPSRSSADLPPVFETVVHMLADAAAQAPDGPALVCGRTRLSYAEYLRCIAGFAQELRDRGASEGRVALVLGNSIEMAVALFAAHAAGAQAVPMNPAYTERELREILRDAEPTAVVYDGTTAAVVEPLIARMSLPNGLKVGGADGLSLLRWRDKPGTVLPETLPAPESLATLQYTGGTTGRPKGVDITHGQLAVNVSQREALLPTRPDVERILCVMPLFHVYAVSMCLHLAAYCRGALVILPRYRPQEVLRAVAGERIMLFPGSPTIYTGLMTHEDFPSTDFSTLRLCYSGAAPLPEDTMRRWEAATGCRVLEGFGQSEAGPVLSFNPERGVRKPRSVGVPVPLTRIEIVDTDAGVRVLPPGQPGEIRARGPQIMSGYRNQPEETATALRDGWLYTGDIGEIDSDGYLFIRGRKKDMAIVGGFNVYPREIEEILSAHPAVLEAAAVGVPDAYRGEIIRAFVVLEDGAKTTTDDLLAHCARNLAKYKVPASVELTEALPKTGVGKTDKTALKALAADAAKPDVAGGANLEKLARS